MCSERWLPYLGHVSDATRAGNTVYAKFDLLRNDMCSERWLPYLGHVSDVISLW